MRHCLVGDIVLSCSLAAVMINPQFFVFHGNLVCNPFRRPLVKKAGVREREVPGGEWKKKKKRKKEKFLSDL